MNVYTENQKEMKKVVSSFIKTVYGKTMFVLSYSMFILFLAQALMILLLYKDKSVFFTLSFLALVAFILGSINYYKELRTYAKGIKIDKN